MEGPTGVPLGGGQVGLLGLFWNILGDEFWNTLEVFLYLESFLVGA